MQAGLAVALLLGAFDFVSKYATGVLARMPRLKLSTSSWAILLGNLEQCSSATMNPLLLLTLVILPLMFDEARRDLLAQETHRPVQ